GAGAARARAARAPAARGAGAGLLSRLHRRGGGAGDERVGGRGARSLPARQTAARGDLAMTGDDDNNDQRLRAAMKKAHEGEHAPPFRALVERRARRRLYLAPLALGAAVLGALVIARRPAPAPPPIAL